jgi:hypothetical protein
MKVLCYL